MFVRLVETVWRLCGGWFTRKGVFGSGARRAYDSFDHFLPGGELLFGLLFLDDGCWCLY